MFNSRTVTDCLHPCWLVVEYSCSNWIVGNIMSLCLQLNSNRQVPETPATSVLYWIRQFDHPSDLPCLPISTDVPTDVNNMPLNCASHPAIFLSEATEAIEHNHHFNDLSENSVNGLGLSLCLSLWAYWSKINNSYENQTYQSRNNEVF